MIFIHRTNAGVGTDMFIVCTLAPPGKPNSFGYVWGYVGSNHYIDGSF